MFSTDVTELSKNCALTFQNIFAQNFFWPKTLKIKLIKNILTWNFSFPEKGFLAVFFEHLQ